MTDLAQLKAAEIATSLLKTQAKEIKTFTKSLLTWSINTIKLQMKSTYTTYFEQLIDSCYKSKSFFVREKAVPLYTFFVPPFVRIGEKTIKHVNHESLAFEARCIILTGVGGSGKSVLLKHLLLTCLRSRTKVPLFLELRAANHASSSLQSLLTERLSQNGFDCNEEFMKGAMKAGHFSFFLDGLDEVEPTRRERLSNEIQQMAEKYNNCRFLVSSRPEAALGGWSGFAVADMLPLSIDQACELLDKLPCDVDVKGPFIADVRKGLYKRHSTFLSNPLLLTIMLLVHSNGMAVPDRMHIFFQHAFEALYERHDAIKAGFKRKRSTKLDITDFGKCFASFCLKTYDESNVSFSPSECIECLTYAKTMTGIEFSEADFLSDLTSATSLLIEDGLHLTFVHRSFQEYFAARFISECSRSEVRGELMRRYASRSRGEYVVRLLHEMRPEIVEEDFLIPVLEKIVTQCCPKGRISGQSHLRYLRMVMNGSLVVVDEGRIRHEGITVDKQLMETAVSLSLERYRLVGETATGGRYLSREMTTNKKVWGIKFDPALARVSDFYTKVLSEHGGIYSIEALRRVKNVLERIRERGRGRDRNLTELLSNSGPTEVW